MDRPKLDPVTATEYEIIAAAQAMHGRSLGELADSHWGKKESGRETKGAAGAIVETYFGIRQNSDQEPDFRAAGIELKVTPLVSESGVPKRVKERTSVSMIDFIQLDRESWPTATVRKKLRRILFVFYEWRAGVPHEAMRVVTTRLWSPPEALLPVLEHDWMAVWTKNHLGRAHEISEGDGRIMGACTKGASGATRKQPHSSEPAKSRAWSLKPRLTWAIYTSLTPKHGGVAQVRETKHKYVADPVEPLLHQLDSFVGMSVRALAQSKGIEPGKAKNRVASVIRLALGLRQKKLPPELEALGLEIKTIPLGPDAYPWEAMSFPAFDPMELPGEEWEDSDLAGRVQDMLMVPVYRGRHDEDLLNQRLCRPFRWSPNRMELMGIRMEWEHFRDLIAGGQIDARPAQSQTNYIHVRPHGQDATDTVPAPGGRLTVRVCFWLNQRFVQELVKSHHSDWRGF